MLDEATRQRIMLHQEGITLGNVGTNGADITCAIARCQIDGIANALIRMQGAEQTASFVFALSDRVSGGVRDVTDYLPPFLGGEAKAAAEPPPIPAEPALASRRRSPDFAYGFLWGLIAMLVVTTLAMGRL